MTSSTFFPYRFAEHSLGLRVRQLHRDGEEIPVLDHVDHDRGVIDIVRVADWKVLKITLEIHAELDALLPVFLEGEDVEDAADAQLALSCPRSRLRWAVPASRVRPGAWTATVELDRPTVAEEVSLQGVLVRRKDAAGTPYGHTGRKGDRVANSVAWKIYLDTRPILPGAAIEGEWKDFSTAGHLRAHVEKLWYLDLSDSDRPKLLLNEGAPGLGSAFRHALESGAPTGQSARIRDALYAAILQPVLSSLFMAAVDTGPKDPAELDGWRKKVVGHFAPMIIPNKDPEESVAEIWDQCRGEDGDRGRILAALGLAVQAHIDFKKTVSYLIKLGEEADG